jgi:TetR/AcrR family transcriptional regulator
MSTARPRQTNQASPVEPDEQTRQRLLRAAVHVFDRNGYAAASVREIVEQAGVTKPALYYHFHSKEGLLSAVLAEGWRQFDAALELAAAGPGTTRARLASLGDAMNALFKQNVPFVRVAHAVFFGPGRIAPGFDLTKFDRSLERAISRIVADGVAAGELVPAEPRDVAVAFAGVVGACAARQLHPPYEALGMTRFRRILGLLFDGIFGGYDETGDRQ